ncbi:sigma-70 family RNA polymerase sigma factor [Bacillus velezensis]|uniref:sigma-70 family RNA polymerase sigma factor n=1 Tax=Bacillus velezensis TaxID=492670 RepID=UPI001A919A6F|nr:sigma-70 family RNA polymerase sigma factor [Bacillus velezensis]BCT30411.1 hypothetical protein BVAD3_40850 [Bacillus velezensis]
MEDKNSQYELIDSLVFQYQSGSSKAGLELIQSFGYNPMFKELSGYLNKYFSLLRYGVIKFNDKDTRQFLRQFTSNSRLKKELIPFYQYAHTKKATRKLVQMINFRLRHIPDEDMIHDLCELLLIQAKKYKKQGTKTNFCGYLMNSYRYKVYDHYKYLFRDLLYSHRIEMLEDHIDDNSEINIEETLVPDLYFQNETEEIGLNWILGKTAEFPFSHLTMFERTLVSLYDHKGMTYEEVGAQMGYHRDTIWTKRKQIKQKLRKLINNPPSE